MNTEVAARPDMAAAIENVLARGDLNQLTAEQRVVHYHNVCRSVGLNPLTQPLQYITLQGKLVLYARKDACDQLRKINGISTEVLGHEVSESGLLTVRVRATDKAGRSDEDYGVVSVKGLQGEAASNAFMKAVTKAKRRVTLSISGLGFLDESEVEERAPQYGKPSLRLDPSMSQEQRSQIASQEGNLGGEAVGHDAVEDTAERVPDRQPSDAERAATEPFVIPRPDDSDASWVTWWQTLMAYVKAAPDADTVNAWTIKNAESMGALQKLDKAKHSKLIDQIKREVASRSVGGT
jgi:hypothetical protein